MSRGFGAGAARIRHRKPGPTVTIVVRRSSVGACRCRLRGRVHGLHQTPEMIASAAVQEVVDAVGLPIMSGADMTLFPAVIDALKAKRASATSWCSVAARPEGRYPSFRRDGRREGVHTFGASTNEIVDWIETSSRGRRSRDAALHRGCQLSPRADTPDRRAHCARSGLEHADREKEFRRVFQDGDDERLAAIQKASEQVIAGCAGGA